MIVGASRAAVACALVAAVVLVVTPGRALAGETVPFPDLSGLDLPEPDEPSTVPFPDLSGLDLPATDEPSTVPFPDLSGLDLPEPSTVPFPDLSGLDLPEPDEPSTVPFPDLSGLDLPATATDDAATTVPFPDLTSEFQPATPPPTSATGTPFPDLSGLDLTETDEPSTVPFPDLSGLDLTDNTTDEPGTETDIGEPATVPFPDLSGLDLPETDQPGTAPPTVVPIEETAPEVEPFDGAGPAGGDDGTSIGFASLRRSIVDTAREVRFPTNTLAAAGLWLVVVTIGSLLIGRTRIMHSITGIKEGLLLPAYTKPTTTKGAAVAFHFRHDATKVWQTGSGTKRKGARWTPVESPAGTVWVDDSFLTRSDERAAQLISARPESAATLDGTEISEDAVIDDPFADVDPEAGTDVHGTENENHETGNEIASDDA